MKGNIYLKYRSNEIPIVILTEWDCMTNLHHLRFYVLLDNKIKKMKTCYRISFPAGHEIEFNRFYSDLKHRLIIKDENLTEEIDRYYEH